MNLIPISKSGAVVSEPLPPSPFEKEEQDRNEKRLLLMKLKEHPQLLGKDTASNRSAREGTCVDDITTNDFQKPGLLIDDREGNPLLVFLVFFEFNQKIEKLNFFFILNFSDIFC